MAQIALDMPTTGNPNLAPPAFHVMTKPRGAICNLDCSYCYFLSKEMLYPGSRFEMADRQLGEYTRQYIESQQVPEDQPFLLGQILGRGAQLSAAIVGPGATLAGHRPTRHRGAYSGPTAGSPQQSVSGRHGPAHREAPGRTDVARRHQHSGEQSCEVQGGQGAEGRGQWLSPSNNKPATTTSPH